MRILKFAAAAALLVLPVASAQASVLGGSLTFDGSRQTLNDDSRGIFIDTNADGIADVVQGVVSLGSSTLTDPNTINNVTGGNLYAAYSFAIEIDVPSSIINPSGPLSVLSFNATGAPGAGFGVMDVLGSLNVTVNDVTTARNAGDALVAIFTDNSGPATNLSAFTNTAGANTVLDLNYSGAATSFDMVLTAGFDGDDDFYSLLNTVVGPLAAPTGFAGSFNGALTVLSDEFGPNVHFLDVLDESGALGNIVIDGQSGGSGTFSSGIAGGFTFGDEASFSMAVVPEPSMFLIFGGLATLGYFGSVRRRLQA